jgi:hypothetical protein
MILKDKDNIMFNESICFNYLQRLNLLGLLRFFDKNFNTQFDLSKLNHFITVEPLKYIAKFKKDNLEQIQRIRENL